MASYCSNCVDFGFGAEWEPLLAAIGLVECGHDSVRILGRGQESPKLSGNGSSELTSGKGREKVGSVPEWAKNNCFLTCSV